MQILGTDDLCRIRWVVYTYKWEKWKCKLSLVSNNGRLLIPHHGTLMQRISLNGNYILLSCKGKPRFDLMACPCKQSVRVATCKTWDAWVASGNQRAISFSTGYDVITLPVIRHTSFALQFEVHFNPLMALWYSWGGRGRERANCVLNETHKKGVSIQSAFFQCYHYTCICVRVCGRATHETSTFHKFNGYCTDKQQTCSRLCKGYIQSQLQL